MSEISEKLILILKEKELKAVNLAEILGKSSGYVSNILNGDNNPGIEVLTLLNEKLNVNINWLLTGKGSMFINDEYLQTPRLDSILDKFKKILKENGIE